MRVAVRIARAQPVLGRNAEAERKAPQRRRDELHVRQHEEPGVERIALVRPSVARDPDASARMLGDESDLEGKVGDVVQGRGVDGVGRAVESLADQGAAVRRADGRGLVKPEAGRKRRHGCDNSCSQCKNLFHLLFCSFYDLKHCDIICFFVASVNRAWRRKNINAEKLLRTGFYGDF